MRKHPLLVLVVAAIGWLPGTVIAGQDSITAASALNYEQLRGEIEQFQAVIETALMQDVGSKVLSSPKGTYLEDYGAIFSMEASLYRIRAISPFSPKPHSRKELDIAHQAMLERVERLKKNVLLAVAEHGASLEQLKPTDNLAVIVHLFNGINDPQHPYPSQLIFKARAGAISDHQHKKRTTEERAGLVQVIQF